ncbi:MAG: hypothetical protein AAF489_07415 [Bacteroidota bacterium]
MKTRLKYLLIFFLLMGAILFFTSDRVVSLGIVNTLEEVNTVEIIVDEKFYKKLELKPSITSEELIHLDLTLGNHTILIRSQTCDINNIFKVFNVVGYNINVEYYQDQTQRCDSFSRESYFSLTYQ